MHYYKHNIGDYRRDTSHLTLLEHGVYRQLMDTYYLSEEPIPAETNLVFRRLGARTQDEQLAVEFVLSEFFSRVEEGPGGVEKGWKHTRCDLEIADYRIRAEASATNGRRGGRPRKEPADNQLGSGAKPRKTLTHEPTNPLTKEKKTGAVAPIAFVLPEWVPAEAWRGYEEMRVKNRKPMTPRARTLVLTELEKLRAAGNDVGAVLDRSTVKGWTDVYAIKSAAQNDDPYSLRTAL